MNVLGSSDMSASVGTPAALPDSSKADAQDTFGANGNVSVVAG